MAGVLKVICPSVKAKFCPTGYFVAGAADTRCRDQAKLPLAKANVPDGLLANEIGLSAMCPIYTR
jgi:hypothetical protein